MEFMRGICNIRPDPRGCVLTLGNFDGIHLGHQQIISTVRTRARELGVSSAVLFFEPQPREYFAHEHTPARLTTLHEKHRFMSSLGIDKLCCLRFSPELAQMEPEDFVTGILLEKFRLRHLIIGDDFRFGRKRRGSFDLLIRMGAETGQFTVEQAPSFSLDGQRVSSTRIREALAQDHLDRACRMLGRPYSITGRIVHGQRLGRTLGFPTANISLKRLVAPVSGVYAISADLGDTRCRGIANVGTRPTVNGTTALLEAHLFGFSGDLYGRTVCVELISKIREERRFADLDALKDQIARDCQTAEELFTGMN